MTKQKHPSNKAERIKVQRKKELSEKKPHHAGKARRLKEFVEDEETLNALKEFKGLTAVR